MSKKQRAAPLHLLSQQFAPASTQGCHESHPSHSEGCGGQSLPPAPTTPPYDMPLSRPHPQLHHLSPWNTRSQEHKPYSSHALSLPERQFVVFSRHGESFNWKLCFLHERHNTLVHSYLHSLNMTITHKTACLANCFLHILAFSFTGWTYLIIKSRKNIKLNGFRQKATSLWISLSRGTERYKNILSPISGIHTAINEKNKWTILWFKEDSW